MKIPFLLFVTLIPGLALSQSTTGWEVALERIGALYQEGLDHLHDPVANSGHLWRGVNIMNLRVQMSVGEAFAGLPHAELGAQPIAIGMCSRLANLFVAQVKHRGIQYYRNMTLPDIGCDRNIRRWRGGTGRGTILRNLRSTHFDWSHYRDRYLPNCRQDPTAVSYGIQEMNNLIRGLNATIAFYGNLTTSGRRTWDDYSGRWVENCQSHAVPYQLFSEEYASLRQALVAAESFYKALSASCDAAGAGLSDLTSDHRVDQDF